MDQRERRKGIEGGRPDAKPRSRQGEEADSLDFGPKIRLLTSAPTGLWTALERLYLSCGKKILGIRGGGGLGYRRRIDGLVYYLGVLAVELFGQALSLSLVKQLGASTRSAVDLRLPFNHTFFIHSRSYTPDLAMLKWVETRFRTKIGQ